MSIEPNAPPTVTMTVTITPRQDDVAVEIWCPAFVDNAEFPDAEQALDWARARISNLDPFEDYGG